MRQPRRDRWPGLPWPGDLSGGAGRDCDRRPDPDPYVDAEAGDRAYPQHLPEPAGVRAVVPQCPFELHECHGRRQRLHHGGQLCQLLQDLTVGLLRQPVRAPHVHHRRHLTTCPSVRSHDIHLPHPTLSNRKSNTRGRNRWIMCDGALLFARARADAAGPGAAGARFFASLKHDSLRADARPAGRTQGQEPRSTSTMPGRSHSLGVSLTGELDCGHEQDHGQDWDQYRVREHAQQ